MAVIYMATGSSENRSIFSGGIKIIVAMVALPLTRNMSLVIPGLESVIVRLHLHVFVCTNFQSLSKEKQGPYLS